jgi:hypothetical protein
MFAFQRLFEIPNCLKLINKREQDDEVPLHIAARMVRLDQGSTAHCSKDGKVGSGVHCTLQQG